MAPKCASQLRAPREGAAFRTRAECRPNCRRTKAPHQPRESAEPRSPVPFMTQGPGLVRLGEWATASAGRRGFRRAQRQAHGSVPAREYCARHFGKERTGGWATGSDSGSGPRSPASSPAPHPAYRGASATVGASPVVFQQTRVSGARHRVTPRPPFPHLSSPSSSSVAASAGRWVGRQPGPTQP